MYRFIGLLLGWMLSAHAADATVYYVDANKIDNSGSGLSWSDAKKDLQEALNLALVNGDEVWVKAGIYLPTLDANGNVPAAASNRDKTFYIKKADIGLYGGFAGTETLLSQRVITATNTTLLSGDLDGTAGLNDAYHVLVTIGRSTNCIVDGFTIQEGRANVASNFVVTTPSVSIYREYGGGMYNENSSPTITNCFFSNNRAASGGGMFNKDGSPVIDLCHFSLNVVTNGGGIYNLAGAPVIKNSNFRANTATHGGGIASSNCNPLINNCIFWANKVYSGGGIYNQFSTPTITNSIFLSNKASGGGGAVTNFNYNSVISNCTFSADTAFIGGGIYYNNDAGGILTNCIFYDNVKIDNTLATGNNVYKNGSNVLLTVSYCLIEDYIPTANSYVSGAGIITGDPLFADALNPAGADGIFRTADDGLALLPCSPAINAGANANAPTTDILGNNRAGFGAVDLGAYEVQSVPVTVLINGDTTLCLNDILQLSTTVPGGSWSNPAPALVTVSPTGLVTSNATAGTDTVIYTVFSGNCPVRTLHTIRAVAPPVVSPVSGAASLCLGSTILLSDSTSGGTWSSNQPAIATIAPNGVLTAVASGTTTISYKVMDTAGCADSAEKVVTVLALPTVAPVTGTTTGICPNDTLRLTSATPGGIWSHSCQTGILTVDSTGLTTGIGAGTCTVRYAVTALNGCIDSADYSLTVYPQPMPPLITGPTGICTGAPVSYTAMPTGGNWQVASGTVAQINAAGTLSAVAPGSETIFYTYTDPNGCASTDSLALTLNAGFQNNLSATLCGRSGVYIFNGKVLYIPGIYSDTLFTTAGCDSITTLMLTQTSGLPATDTSVQQTPNGLLANAVGAGVTYQWMLCGPNNTLTLLSDSTGQGLSPTVAGSYAVVVTTGGCSSVSGCHFFDPATLAVHNLDSNAWHVFPNPATKEVEVSSTLHTIRRIILYDVTGKQLSEMQPNTAQVRVFLDKYPAGFYLLRAWTTDDNSEAFRIQIMR